MRLPTPQELEKLRSIINYQFGHRLGDKLLRSEIRIETSIATGRIRHIYAGGKLIATLRAQDGYLAITIYGAQLLRQLLPILHQRIMIQSDVAEFASEGKSVFAKHVLAADPELRPGDEAMIVDEADNLLAVGRAVLSGEEVISLKKGRAVKTREGAGRAKDEP